MEKLLEVKNIKKIFQQGKTSYTAVDDVSFHIEPGECVGLVGESGCGKSTTAKMITQIQHPDSGSIWFEGQDITNLKGKEQRRVYEKLQMVFQSPQGSFDPRCKLGVSLMEGLRNQGISKEDARRQAEELLNICGLSRDYMNRYPHQVSGGECQRAAIARAVVLNPKLLICDEVTSALDVTVQEQIIKLLQRLRKERKLACLFICHDLALVQQMCDRVLVMYRGRILEQGTPEEVICHPREAYTQKLIDSVYDISC